MSGAPLLSLADLEAFDPQAPRRGATSERRFLCPLCGTGKPHDAAHRSLCANTQTGAFRCHRCGVVGKLRENWQEKPALDRRTRARAALSRAFELPAPKVSPAEAAPPGQSSGQSEQAARVLPDWRAALGELRPLDGTTGAAYLSGRGVPYELAHLAGARYAPCFYGRAAVVFPLRDYTGALVAAQGRYLDKSGQPKARTVGDKRAGLFAASGAWELPALILTEAPIDALSLAAAGYPALALCGTTGPAWLHRKCAFRRVLLAFDADQAGDGAAEKLAPELESFGARCERLRPEGGKDWNEQLQTDGRGALADFLALWVLFDSSERPAL